MEREDQMSSRDAVCFMHKETCKKKSQMQEPMGDHLFQCEHAWVNMLKSKPEEIPPEGLCTRKRCYQEARETIDEVSMSECYSYLRNLEHLLAEPLRKESSWDSSRHLVGECMTFLKATPQERFRKAMTPILTLSLLHLS